MLSPEIPNKQRLLKQRRGRKPERPRRHQSLIARIGEGVRLPLPDFNLCVVNMRQHLSKIAHVETRPRTFS
jgi:hypothetical protein